MVHHTLETVVVVALVVEVPMEVQVVTVALATTVVPVVNQDLTQRPVAQKPMVQELPQEEHQTHTISQALQLVAQEVIQELMDWQL
jgi:hypothetical protein